MKNSTKKEELMILAGQRPYSAQNKQLDVWQNFYDRLKDIRVTFQFNTKISFKMQIGIS